MLTRHATSLKLREGKRLMNSQTGARDFVLLESGTARVEVSGETIAELGSGDFCGEIALLDPEYDRRADVVAETDVEVFVLDPRGFHQMMSEVPLAADRIREAAATRRN